MSIFIQGKEHIDHLVTAVIHAKLSALTPDEIGRMLWRENLNSAKYRYPDNTDGTRPGPADFKDSDVATYTWTKTPLLDGQALHTAIKGYCYQACEHPEWETCEAKQLMDKLDAPTAHLDLDNEHWEIYS